MSSTTETPLLSVRDLAVSYATAEGGKLQALDGVSFDVPSGRTVAIVGESGCGKTATALSIMRLLPSPGATIDRGRILFQGEDLLGLSQRDMQRIRGGTCAIPSVEVARENPQATARQSADMERIALPARRNDCR